jgi:hypothetical protein
MPTKPAPSVKSRTSRSASPITTLIAIMPDRPPEMSIVIMMILVGLMPA